MTIAQWNRIIGIESIGHGGIETFHRVTETFGERTETFDGGGAGGLDEWTLTERDAPKERRRYRHRDLRAKR